METLKKYSLILVSTLLLLSGCAHVTPVLNDPEQPSFDGNEQNSGFVKQNTLDGRPSSYEITADARDRYNRWIATKYGKRLAIPQDFGITPMDNGNYDLTMQGAMYWKQMILDWQREQNDKAGTIINKIGL